MHRVARSLLLFSFLTMPLAFATAPLAAGSMPVPSRSTEFSCQTAAPLVAGSRPYTQISYYGQWWYNWDVSAQSETTCQLDQLADWPITMVFLLDEESNAETVRQLAGSNLWTLQDKYLLVDTGTGWQWSSDTGVKRRFSTKRCTLNFLHMRVYAPREGYFYSPRWGRFVVATTHIDYCELHSQGSLFGYSESAEDWYADYFRRLGYRVEEDCLWMANAIGGQTGTLVSRNHVAQSDGRATVVFLTTGRALCSSPEVDGARSHR